MMHSVIPDFILERLCGLDEPDTSGTPQTHATALPNSGTADGTRLSGAAATAVASAARRTLELKRSESGGGRAGAPYLRQPSGTVRRAQGTDAQAATSAAGEVTPVHREIYDAQNGEALPGHLERNESAPAGADVSVNQAYDGLGATFELFEQVFSWSSVDDKNLPLLATVHYGVEYDNAFWNGQQMVFGDGDGHIFNNFTSSLSVIGHELAHGFTQYTTNLVYHGQSGALNESISDVFGVMVEQYSKKQSAAQATWLVGAELLAPGVKGAALRSMKAPGTAYDDPNLGKDPQPGAMSEFVNTTSDNGGVHINSGIPNRAFYLAATAIGGNSWEGAGRVWFTALTNGSVNSNASFEDFAAATSQAAVDLFGADSHEVRAVQQAWATVGVTK